MTDSLSTALPEASTASTASTVSAAADAALRSQHTVTSLLSPSSVSLTHARAAQAIGPRGAYAVLDQFGVIDALGADALDFLHNQLTNDVSHLTMSAAAIGGLCSPKGRLIASFLYWRQVGSAAPAAGLASANPAPSAPASAVAAVPFAATAPALDGVRLLVAADIREAIQKRLSMFVLRAKVKLSDATSSVGLIGVSVREDQQLSLLSALGEGFEALPDTLRDRADSPAGTLIRLSDAAGFCRYLLVFPREALERLSALLDASLARVTSSVWDWLDVRSAEPRITANTQDAFVPQMINFEAIGGVSFRKGCYPGQEVVARSQYRGTVKRRATIARIAPSDGLAEVKAGDEIFDHGDPQQPCGHVVNTAPSPEGGVDCLVELKLALDAGATLHVGSIDGPLLTVEGLPYALPDLTA